MKSDYKNISDDDLLSRFRAEGNSEWLGILLERYTLLLFGVCMKYLKHEEEAKDVVQQVFLKALSEFPKYTVSNVGGWLYQVAKNQCLTNLRNKKEYLVEEQLGEIAQPEAVPLPLLLKREEHIDKMKEALTELKEDQRVCIAAFYLEKKSYKQIAESTGFTVKQVKSHIQNGKRNLRLKLESRL